MNRDDLVAFLDGELSPSDQEAIERELPEDPAAFAFFRELCRQRLMLAEFHALLASDSRKSPGPRFRLRWQVVAATLLFAASILAVWRVGQDAKLRVLSGTVLVAGRPADSIPTGVPMTNSGSSPAKIELRDGAVLALLPASSAVVRRAPEFVEVERGAVRIRVREGTEEVRILGKNGTIRVRGSEFCVELVPGSHKGGQSMESLLALVVSVLVGQAEVEVAGLTKVVAAGESRVFGADGAVAETLPAFLAAQDEKEKKGDEKKDGEGKEKKEKKKDKKEGKGKKEKEDDDDKDEKGGKGKKKEKDDDDKEEKGGKEKGKKDD